MRARLASQISTSTYRQRMVIAVTVVTVGAALAVPVLLDNWRATAGQVRPITQVPADNRALGLVGRLSRDPSDKRLNWRGPRA